MLDLTNKQVLVAGLGPHGEAACGLLRRRGASVFGLDPADTPALRETAGRLQAAGVRVALNAAAVPEVEFQLAVIGPEIRPDTPLLEAISRRLIPMLGEFELGAQLCSCLSIAVAGMNGKGTTAELIERILLQNHRKTLRAGHAGQPFCAVADRTRELDFVVLQVKTPQLERVQFFRPAVAVLLNLPADSPDRRAAQADFTRTTAGLFRNQQAFDWAIVQAEALADLKAAGLTPPSKVITFSARNQEADIYLDRGLIISRLANWPGPLLNTDQCRLRGPHNAENLMAALAVGHALRLPLDGMVEILKAQNHGAHRFELVAEKGGVQFINDSKATNVEALRNALLAARPGEGGKPNVWLLAGGRDAGADFHSVGPVVSKRVKGAFLIGEAREKIRAAWSLFTPCTLSNSLLEALAEAAKNAAPGDVVLLSPACSSFDQFRNYQQRGEKFCQAVNQLVGVGPSPTPT